MAAAPVFDVPPEKRAGIPQFLYRQFFVTPPLLRDVDLKGKTAIVTGSNTGIGLECARQLLDLGLTTLILAVRDEAKGLTARTDLASGRPDFQVESIEVWKLDLESYDSITAFADRAKTLDRLDIVVLNAGVMKQKHELTSTTKHEQTIQINLLSTALLGILLLPTFKATKPSEPGRIAFVSSDMASWGKFKEKDTTPLLPAFDKPETFGVPDRYSTSKLLGQLFITELAKRVPASVAIITMPNPGLCYGTRLGRAPGGSVVDNIGSFFKRIFGRSPSVGARALTDGVVRHGPEAHGQYLEDCKIQPKAPLVYKPEGERSAKLLWDETIAELSFARVEDIVRELGKSA